MRQPDYSTLDLSCESRYGKQSGDVPPQYPVKVSAVAMMDGREVRWERCLNTAKGQTTIKGAKDMISVAADYQKRLRDGVGVDIACRMAVLNPQCLGNICGEPHGILRSIMRVQLDLEQL